MPSDYDQIRKDNIKEYGEGVRHLAYLGSLYPDPTHFVFELLQNAEDAEATQVRFIVSHDKLKVMHDGRCFNDKDVRGVCGIGEGEKADDLTKIGRFGIGFKSVYAYTTRPEIHSGDDHFRIENYVRPWVVKARDIDKPWTTLFVFPFDKDEPDQKAASDKISKCLGELNIRTLLFLKSIKKVKYKIPRTEGIYRRKESTRDTAREIEIVGQSDGEEETEDEKTEKWVKWEETEKWMVFKRSVQRTDSHDIYVELGFRITTRNDTFKRERQTPLVVYFPTEKRTDLGFLIQGPYRTTLARDNVPKDDPWNMSLIKETAELVVSSLHELKEMRLLTVSLLETLPINADDFPSSSMFHPIFTRVKEALMTEELLPTNDGSFVASKNALLARGVDLMKLLKCKQLSKLWSTDVRWLPSTITPDRTSILRTYLTNELGIKVVTPELFADKITNEFMACQPDEWVQEFYCFLCDHKRLWQTNGVLLNKPILRLQDGSHVFPLSRPKVYLSGDANTEISVPIIKVNLTQLDRALKFLKELGIPEFDSVEEVLELILPKYKGGAIISADQSQYDLEKIKRAMSRSSGLKRRRLTAQLVKTAFIPCTVPANKRRVYRRADKIYFRSNELCGYFEGDESFAYVDPDHAQHTLFKELGVADSVRIQCKWPDHGGYVRIHSSWGYHSRGLKGFDPNIFVDGLEQALDAPTVRKGAFIWNNVAIPYFDCIRGIVESSTTRNFRSSTRKERISESFGRLLMDREWLPDLSGKMHRPCDLRLNDLHHAFKRHRGVARQLAMKTDADPAITRTLSSQDQQLEIARRIQEASPEDQHRIYKILGKGNDEERPQFSRADSADPERRRLRMQRAYSEAPKKSYINRIREVRPTRNRIDPQIQLREWYTNEFGEMVCQICRSVMPFKKRDEEYYFEAVEALSDLYLPKEYESQYLALCPLCAAKYKEFVKRDGKAMKEVYRALMESNRLDVSLTLGTSSASVRFVQKHFIDLQEILRLSVVG